MHFWILSLDQEFCTVDDLRLGHHGWNFDKGGYAISVRRGDVAVLFDQKDLSFLCIGRFMIGVAAAENVGSETRYDFLVDVTSRRETRASLNIVRRRLVHPNHPVRAKKWPSRVITKVTRAQFDDLMSAWWGVLNLSTEFEESSAEINPAGHQKYTAYSYAFDRLSDAIDREYYLEAVAISESIISDRILSACQRVGELPSGSSLSALLRLASQMTPPLPRATDFDQWRDHRNKVIHGIVKGNKKTPLLQTAEFLQLAGETAVKGADLARTASIWAKKIK